MLTGIIGGIGSGKTLLMTLLGYLEHLNGRSVLANYHLHFPYAYLNLRDVLGAIMDKEQLEDIVMLIDEIHIAFDSRTSMTDRNRYGSYFVLQTRKRNVHLYFTSQSIWQVEVRIRENVDRLITCESLAKQGMPDVFRYHIIDYTTTNPTETTITMNGNICYSLYDTKEIIDISDDYEPAKKSKNKQPSIAVV